MNRLVIATGTVAMLLLVACGSSAAGASASASSSGSSSGAGGPGGLGRNGAAGELVQINGTALILNTTAGDVAVQFTSTTPVTKTSTGTVADIVTGACVAITGTKDATGAITANNVRLSDAINGACPAGRGPGGGGPGGGVGDGTGTGSRSGTSTGNGSGSGGGARPTPPANLASARGLVTAVTGTSVTVQDTTGAPVTVTVPTTVQVSRSSTAQPSDLAVGDCVAAIGTKDTSGTVTARSLSVVPAGPSGCFTGGGGRGFGGFGGGRGGGGGGSASATGTAG
jgi:hypothetical protein